MNTLRKILGAVLSITLGLASGCAIGLAANHFIVIPIIDRYFAPAPAQSRCVIYRYRDFATDPGKPNPVGEYFADDEQLLNDGTTQFSICDDEDESITT